MNISKVFIDRPVLAGVLSFFIFLLGAITLPQLPVAEYPRVSPPSIVVSANFPGANPRVIAETVAAPLEEQINGVEGMLYMSSQSTTNGAMSLGVTFEIGSDINLAQQLVQNRVSQALPRLPSEVRELGVSVVKSSNDLTMVVHLNSPDEKYDALYMRNYAVLNLRDHLAKVAGVGDVQIFGGGDYAMRIWLNPERIAELGLNATDVIGAIREQNIQVAAGIIGDAPYGDGVETVLPISARGRLSSPEEFEQIIVATGSSGEIIRLGDLARVELGANSYGLRSTLNNESAVGIGIFKTSDSNALEISAQVREVMATMAPSLPQGLEYEIVYDPTEFVQDSIDSVITTLLEALALVVFVVILFLQSWRASIIPLLAVPVSIVGTFTFMYLLGYSINVLTLFGLILAIGVVVDDAIIVVENVERNISRGLKPAEACYQAMREVTGPIIATTLVLLAVFIPIAFISGLSGQFYRQFAVTIAISTVISAINSLTLSPALARLLLKPKGESTDFLSRAEEKYLGGFFTKFNGWFGRRTEGYARSIGYTLSRRGMALGVFGLLLLATVGSFETVPKGFVPAQDKQYLISFAQLPEGATLDRTEKVIEEMSRIAMEEPGVSNAVAFTGLSIAGFSISPSAGIVFVPLDDFADRKDAELNAFAIAQKLQAKYAAIDEAFIAIFPPPAVPGMGTVGGFKLQIEDRADHGYEALNDTLQQVLNKAWQSPELTGVFSSYKINVPQLYTDLNRDKAKRLGLDIDEIFATMQIYLGSAYVNDFNQFGRTYSVVAQADKDYRSRPEHISQLKVRNRDGEMIPLGSVVQVSETFGPESAVRYNGYRAADVNGNPAAGFSSGEAEAKIIEILDETLPAGMTYEWTELSYQQQLAGNTALWIFPLCILLVFMVLAAQYESLTLPLAVVMIIPTGVLAALVGVMISGGDNNIFTQISLFVLMALATKNAILIVEFARDLENQGRSIMAAALESSRLRLRPILMTSFAFIMGVMPMAFSSGAGAEMRSALGIAVFSGMLGVTLFGLFLTPVFYVVLRKWESRKALPSEKEQSVEVSS